MLNEKQLQAVNHKEGQLLVVSCPGSGKTTVIVNRTQKLIESGVKPENILVITFTKEAANQMQNRFEREFGKTNVMFGTIHSICFKVLSKAYGYNRSNILLATEQWEFFRKFCINKIEAPDMEEYIKNLILQISKARNSGENPQTAKIEGVMRETFLDAIKEYTAFKRQMGKIDFDDMLILCRNVFQKKPEELRYWKRQFPYIMIDEFQDTNGIQAEIFYLLAGVDGNLCVVGDDDQSIYRFRAADSSIMLDFPKKYPNCKIIYMDTNYRSSSRIIETANQLISRNKTRFSKNFECSKTSSGEVTVERCRNMSDEMKGILHKLSVYQSGGTPFQEMAVLYRTNLENQLLIGQMMKYNIPFYTTENPVDFHSDFVFQDIMAYWRLAEGAEQKGDMQRVLNRPIRYLKADLFKKCSFNEREMLECCSKVNKNSGSAIRAVIEMHRDVKQLRGKSPEQFLDFLLYEMNYKGSVESYCNFIHRDKDSVMTMLTILRAEAEQFQTMEEWMAYAAFYAEELKRKKAAKEKEGVCLSTFHSAKGLEWERVLIMNANEGVCPYHKAQTEEDLEEERRLFYVAVTRAKTSCNIFYNDISNGKKVAPSPYLYEMGLISHRSNNRKTKRIRPVIR